MNIRAAGTGDIEALSRLAVGTYVAAFGASMSAADLDAHIRKHLLQDGIGRMVDNDTVLVAEVEERMAGFVQIGAARSAEDVDRYGDFELRRIYVRTESQGQGIGAGLMQAAIDAAERMGARQIFLDVWNRNLGAQRFYKRFGFSVVGEREFVVESGAETDPDLIMVRDLST